MATKGEAVVFNIKLPVALRDALNELAAKNERTAAAEVRIAIRRHLVEHGAVKGFDV